MPAKTDLAWLLGAALCLLSACGGDPAPPQVPDRDHGNSARPTVHPNRAPEQAKPSVGGKSATEILRRYYGLIEKRRYGEALALREAGETSVEAFAAHFDGFASQKVTIGVPSEPVEAGGWLYVEVPVQTYGIMKNGTPFGSAGTVTLRRRATSGEWRIYTK